MTLPQAQTIDAPEADYLYVQASSIPGAGKGLFTAIPIHRGEVIAVFEGERLSAAEAKRRAERSEDGYFVTLLDGSTLDSMHTACFAKYANDVEGPGNSRLRNNAVITLDDDDRPCVMATRTIKAGGEVFVGYGKAYWRKRQWG
ncbi:MAG: SET domain-containing protein-lysine N-methyltransferase [Flavobacteriales bacterium]